MEDRFTKSKLITTTSPLRWAGSKRRLVPKLLEKTPPHFERYIEPFAGSAALWFCLKPQVAVLADINGELINFYKVLQRSPRRLFDIFSAYPRTANSYLCVRATSVNDLTKIQRAARFWYLNRNCFNGLYRTNLRGEFNVPFGSKLSDNPTLEYTLECYRALRSAVINENDFEATIDIAKRGDFLYVDPPYKQVLNRGEYGCNAMKDSDLPRLISAIKRAHRRGAKILLSYNVALETQLPKWHHEVINVRYLISAKPEHRKLVTETIARNYT